MHHRFLFALALSWLVSLCLAWPVASQAEVAVPPLQTRVMDLTQTLSVEQTAALEASLKIFETGKGSQIAVLIVPTTQPEAIEQYALRVAEQWKLGRKGVDDGVLLLVAKNDRKVRIEVGYGLEGALNDATAKRIISEYITPLFKQGNFYGGIEAGVTRIVKIVEGEVLPEPATPQDDPILAGILFVFFLFFSGVFGLILRQAVAPLTAATIAAGTAGGGAGLLGGMGIGAVILAGIVFGLTLLIPRIASGGRPSTSGSSSSSSSGSGWSSSSSSSSSGGFSGGGGSFGGGGASGDW